MQAIPRVPMGLPIITTRPQAKPAAKPRPKATDTTLWLLVGQSVLLALLVIKGGVDEYRYQHARIEAERAVRELQTKLNNLTGSMNSATDGMLRTLKRRTE